ncbi:MAG: sensor histidine kinase [Dermatophilaceae bacterium]
MTVADGGSDRTWNGPRALPARVREPAWVQDLAVTSTTMAFSVAVYFMVDATAAERAAGVALIVVQCIPLMWRRTAAARATAVMAVPTVAYYILELPLGRIDLAPLVAIYSIAAYETRRVVVVAALAVMGFVGFVNVYYEELPTDRVINAWVLVVGLLVLGWSVSARAHSLRLAALERARAASAAERAHAAEQRADLLQRFHDIAGHGLAVVSVQAAAAGELVERDPEAARDALDVVGAAARSALGRIRSLVDSVAGPEDLDVRLAALSADGPGLRVAYRVDGSPRRLPDRSTALLVATVREGLTNAIVHAHASTAEVVLSDHRDEVEVAVTTSVIPPLPPALDPGRARSVGLFTGTGISSLQRDVRACGGSVESGADDSGRWVLRTVLANDVQRPCRDVHHQSARQC